MAEINTYPLGTPAGNTRLAGTQMAIPQSDGTSLNLTRNFTIESIAPLINQINLGYTVYTAQLTAGAGAAPTATILQNTTGLTFVWSRNGTATGQYLVTVSEAVFIANKFWAIVSAKGSEFPSIVRTADDIARVDNILCNTAVAVDGITEGFVEIRIYS
jgi:hypothetical protein